MGFEWYREFVDTSYTPREDDIVVLFRFEPAEGMEIEDVVGRIASESSVGTWTTLSTLDERIYNMRARAFWYNDRYTKVAYPLELWELGSIPQLLSGVEGNIFGMKAVKRLRVIDFTFPKEYVRSFEGPNYGVDAIRKIFKKREGPVLASVPKPKLGLTAEQHAEIAYEIYMGGFDVIKDDENLTDQSFNRFEKRVVLVAKARDRAESETGEVKDAFLNVTAPTLREMERRVEIVYNHGFRYVMLDILTAGWSALQTLSEIVRDYDMAIHAHRAFHAAVDRVQNHGVTMLSIAKLARLGGADNLHIGTGVGKMEGEREEVVLIKEEITQDEVEEVPLKRLRQRWYGMKPILPTASGGLHAGILPDLFEVYGTFDICIQVGGGVHGHPDGSRAGALSVVQAIEAIKEGISLEEAAEKHEELRKALEKWGRVRPR